MKEVIDATPALLATEDASTAPDCTLADLLNQDCHCLSLDPTALARALDVELGTPGLADAVRARCPFVFAAQPVFVAASHLRGMGAVVQAIEAVVALPAWREAVLSSAPETANIESRIASASSLRGV